MKVEELREVEAAVSAYRNLDEAQRALFVMLQNVTPLEPKRGRPRGSRNRPGEVRPIPSESETA